MIRALRSEDIPVVADIGNRAWQPIYDMFEEVYGDDLFGAITKDRLTAKGEQVSRHCANHPDWIYICEEQGQIVGFVTFTLDHGKKIGQIGNNAVDPTCGLKGIGQQMYKAVLQRFKDEGMAYAKVGTGMDDAHGPARRAYERAGFDISHQDITYYKKLT